MKSNRIAVSVCVGLAVAAALTGCGSSQPAKPSLTGKAPLYPQITAAPAAAVAKADGSQGAVMSLPLDAYIMTPAQTNTLNEARHYLLASCAARFGYPASSVGGVPPVVSAESQSPLTWFRPTMVDEAGQFGYHPAHTGTSPSGSTSTGQAQASTGPAQPAPPSPDPALNTVMRGTKPGAKAGTVNGRVVPAGGCMGEATAKLDQGQNAQDANFVTDLRFQLAVRAQNESPQIRAVNTAWSDCMKSMGFPYATPKDAAGDQRWSTTPTASAAEIATAVADATCKQKVNLVDVVAGVYQGYETQAISDHATELKAVKDWQDGELANAAKVVAACAGSC